MFIRYGVMTTDSLHEGFKKSLGDNKVLNFEWPYSSVNCYVNLLKNKIAVYIRLEIFFQLFVKVFQYES